MPVLLRVLTGLLTACFVVVGSLLVLAPDLSRFGFVAFALVFAMTGLAMATDAAGTAQTVARCVGRDGRAPSALASVKAARLWGAVCSIAGLSQAALAWRDDGF